MQHRESNRLPAELPVEFVILGKHAGPLQGYIRDVSEEGLLITTKTRLEPGSFLQIEVEDTLFFGEVKYCYPRMSGWIAGLYIERVLFGRSELSQLVARASHGSVQPRLASYG